MVDSPDETLNVNTAYNYTLTIESFTAFDPTPRITAHAASIYGVFYALETLTQLLSAGGALPCSQQLFIRDGPQYAWRGFMVDTGRRFFPPSLLSNLFQTMAANKLNVLHLHASDRCRFSVESKLFPALTNNLTGIRGGYYNRSALAQVIADAADQGIRVVPEFDVPGHSRGFLPIAGHVNFCSTTNIDQLYNDPQGV